MKNKTSTDKLKLLKLLIHSLAWDCEIFILLFWPTNGEKFMYYSVFTFSKMTSLACIKTFSMMLRSGFKTMLGGFIPSRQTSVKYWQRGQTIYG